MNWYLEVLRKYTVFTGRATRTEYWMFFLVNVLISLVLGFLDLTIIGYIYTLAVLLPSIGVAIRRLHDTGKSGWWLLIGLIPFLGAIILIVFLAMDSEPGQNQYGPSIKGVTPTASVVSETTPAEEKPQEEVVINDIPAATPDDIVVAPEILEEKN